jgi:mitogen-activated protein kinase 1/3
MVAIKKVKSIFDDIVDAKRMLREITILRTMDHPNIVRMKDIIADAENPSFDSMIFVMEKA